MSGRKPRKPRWLPTADTLAIARSRAAKMPDRDRQELIDMLRISAKALREGVAASVHWGVLSGALAVAYAIEERGIVRGLRGHLECAERALQAIHDRAMRTGDWTRTALYFDEINAIDELVDLHIFQLNQLGRIEYLSAIKSSYGAIRSGGGHITTVTDIAGLQAQAV